MALLIYCPAVSEVWTFSLNDYGKEQRRTAAREDLLVTLNYSLLNHERTKPKIKLQLNAAKLPSAIACSSDLMRRNHCIP